MAKNKKLKKPSLADRADKHDLYEAAVQDVESEIDFVIKTWKSRRKRPLKLLREDFAGTTAAACEFVKRSPEHCAWAVDIDPEVLAWGRANRVAKLKPAARSRIELVEGNVLDALTPKVDVLMAMNFSYWLFKSRDDLRGYFETVRDGLVADGMVMMDAFGGYEAYKELTEKRDCGKFTYVWTHERYDPISGDMDTRIDFHFPDKSKMKSAFTYTWRLWSLPEIRELLAEAGFSKVTVYWQGWDDDGEANGDFEPAEQGEADAGWIVYIVAEK